MIQDLTPYEIGKYIKRAIKNASDGLEGLKPFQIQSVIDAVDAQIISKTHQALVFIDSNPNYTYPQPNVIFEKDDFKLCFWYATIQNPSYFQLHYAKLALNSYQIRERTNINVEKIYLTTCSEFKKLAIEYELNFYEPYVKHKFFEKTLPYAFRILKRYLEEKEIRQKDDLRNEYLESYKKYESSLQDIITQNAHQSYLISANWFKLIFYRNLGKSFVLDVRQMFDDSEDLLVQDGKKSKLKVNELLFEHITHAKKIEIANALKEKYSSYKGKEFKILYEALIKLDLWPQNRKRKLFFRCLKNEGYNINNAQMLEDKYFNTGYENHEGEYVKTKDEEDLDRIVKFLETIIK